MKSFFSITVLILLALDVYSQGTVSCINFASPYLISTNTAISQFSFGNEAGGVSGKTQTIPNSYHFALLVMAYNAQNVSTNPFASGWLDSGVMGTNAAIAGGIASRFPATPANWAAPTDGSYNSSQLNNFTLVGWSSNLGETWADVKNLYVSNGNWFPVFLDGTHYFGVSALGSSYAGGGPDTLPPAQLFGTSNNSFTPGPGGLVSGFSLFQVGVVPEPSSVSLVFLGSASLLMFLRHKIKA